MGYFSIWHWLIVIIILILLFGGRGKVSSILGDIAKGLKSFKKGFQEDDSEVKNKKINIESKNDEL